MVVIYDHGNNNRKHGYHVMILLIFIKTWWSYYDEDFNHQQHGDHTLIMVIIIENMAIIQW